MIDVSDLRSVNDLAMCAGVGTEWIIPGVLPVGQFGLIYGDPESGKSLLAIDLAAHVASGRSWQGRDTPAGLVFYSAGEGVKGVIGRFKAFDSLNGTQVCATPYAERYPEKLSLFVPNSGEKLKNIFHEFWDNIEEARCACPEIDFNGDRSNNNLLVIDTYATHTGGADEDRASDVKVFISNIERIIQYTDMTVLVIHHAGKDGKLRGSTALPAAADFIWHVKKTRSGVSKVNVEKSRDFKTDFHFSFRPRQVDLVTKSGQSTSIVLEAVEPHQESSPSSKLNSASTDALATLEAIATHKNSLVSIKGWRQSFYETYSGTPEAKKKAFQRAQESLEALRLIKIEGDVVQLV